MLPERGDIAVQAGGRIALREYLRAGDDGASGDGAACDGILAEVAGDETGTLSYNDQSYHE